LKKRLFYLVLVSVIVLSFAGCHNKKDKEETPQQTQEEVDDQESDDEIEEEFEEGEFGDFE